MKNKGWVKIWRDQYNSWISKKPFCDGYAWTYLYSQANHKKGMVNFRNEYIEVERGQVLTSKLKLQEIFGWTYRHVENFLLALKNDENIGYRTSNRYIVITIINYEEYQGNGEQSDEQNEEQSKNRLGTEQEQIRNEATQTRIKRIKNVKNVNNEKNEEKIDSVKNHTIIREQIIYYLNTEAKKNYKLNTPVTKRLINARLEEGYLLNDFRRVIDIKCEEWKGRFTKDGKNMEDWLRPQTLFGNKFESYLNQSRSCGDDHRFDFIDEEENLIG